ncbi:DUF2288 domain-containing protein [Halomicronema hongdechloris]|nr:DUF2288 domain-containing protein [Halomicronema hongdechloris]
MVDSAEWTWLQPHANRDAVVVVDQALDLVDVGVAIATDNVTSVDHWIGEQLLRKPTLDQLIRWERTEGLRFQALIVPPYVLVQQSPEAT